MMAELATLDGKLYCLDMNQVLHVLDVAMGDELLRLPFTHDLRPTVVPLPDSSAVMAPDTDEIQLVAWQRRRLCILRTRLQGMMRLQVFATFFELTGW